ncbi:MAG: methionine adenosyltransferase, partial [Firmicutes bacterium]|nr:methionine adenosyltransferase [Bacillota bacterium]
ANTGNVMVMGEINTIAYIDIQKVAREVICDIGYNTSDYGFDGNACAVITSIDEQSGDIAMGVDKALEYKEGDLDDELEETGAGDQGIMFGFACDETPELMPMPISLAHRLARRLTEVRKNGTLSYLRPDGKTQVTVEYEDDIPVRVDTIVISTQHDDDVTLDQISRDMIEQVVVPIVDPALLDENTKYFINPTGRFVIGGPHGDSGLTGRKIIVDTYGGYARHGGGAFSGKDPTKVDRSATYAARYVAKNLVAAGLARKCEIQLAYAIGVARPVSILVDSFGTGKVSDERLAEIIEKNFDLRPAAIIRDLDLRRPIYRQVAAYGHFGRTDIDVPWERLDKVEQLKKEV